MTSEVLRLHTYFLFPFCIDQDAVMVDHPEIWDVRSKWFDKLDLWVTGHVAPRYRKIGAALGGWKRNTETRFDSASPVYQDMLFFHPFVRRAFFDTGNLGNGHEALVRSYAIGTADGCRPLYRAESAGNVDAIVPVTDLRLLLFANGIGILIMGVEAHDISYAEALWINEMMRKIYPSSDRQIQSGRIPNRFSLVLDTDGHQDVLVEERFQDSRLIGFRPQLSEILLGLIHFADYHREEFEPVLDERMVVNSFVSLNRDRFGPEFAGSEDYEIAFSRFLFVDRAGPGYRYEPEFIREQMRSRVYRRWQHEGTLYGATSYSNVTSILTTPLWSTDSHLVYRMFKTKNHLIALIALFYRASLLNFAKESALVSRQMFPVFSGQVVRHHHILSATRLMADFNYFNNYWYFSELTTKDEELEHFRLICDAYRIDRTKEEIGSEIDKLAGYIDRLYALRNSDAVNRLAMQSVILGIGALVTGFYGMNIPQLASSMQNGLLSSVSMIVTLVMTILSVSFILYIVASNWVDYRASLLPRGHRSAPNRRPPPPLSSGRRLKSRRSPRN